MIFIHLLDLLSPDADCRSVFCRALTSVALSGSVGIIVGLYPKTRTCAVTGANIDTLQWCSRNYHLVLSRDRNFPTLMPILCLILEYGVPSMVSIHWRTKKALLHMMVCLLKINTLHILKFKLMTT